MGHIHITIDGHSLAALDVRFAHEPSSFFEGQLHLAEHYRATHDDAMPGNLFWLAQEAKWKIDEVRYAHWHPRLAGWFREMPSSTSTIGTLSTSGSPPGGSPGMAVVPEPGTVLMATTGLIAVVAWLWLVGPTTRLSKADDEERGGR